MFSDDGINSGSLPVWKRCEEAQPPALRVSSIFGKKVTVGTRGPAYHSKCQLKRSNLASEAHGELHSTLRAHGPDCLSQAPQNAAKAPFTRLTLPLQCDLRLSAAELNSMTHAAAAKRNLDAAFPLRSADTG